MSLEPNLWATLAILGYVSLQRGFELLLARRNTRGLLREGAVEAGAAHYPVLVALHALWLATLWVTAFGQPINLMFLAAFALVQVLRFWTLASLGRRWTTRILVVPGEALVTSGPYRFITHPNYVVVVLEIALLPAIFGLHAVSIVFTLLNAAALAIRIPAETRALKNSARKPS